MTDKELKKLSRLELLELLLAESRENDRLRAEIERLDDKQAVEKSAQHLNEAAKQLDSALEKVLSMMPHGNNSPTDDSCKDSATSHNEVPAEQADSEKEKAEAAHNLVDYNIYKKLIIFFKKNPYALSVLPDDLHQEVSDRINAIQNNIKKKTAD